MFTYDERIRGLPASRDQVLTLHASLNSPHLAIPGKAAGPAQSYIVGLRGAQGYAVFVYLYLGETQDCAVYVPARRNLGPEEFRAEEADALGFVESMGFMMDNLNFRARPPAEQDELLRTLPAFLRDPRLAAGTVTGKPAADDKKTAAVALGRLLASF
ncbi:MAG: social motility and stimulation tgl protein [Myxococcaceae bacterium]|nr:social motility and stimulation tgl protein [Myxococcaceae bacterium]